MLMEGPVCSDYNNYMIKRMFMFLWALLLLYTPPSFAELQVGAGGFTFDYREVLSPPFKSTEQAFLPYYELSFQTPARRSLWHYAATIRFAQGETLYDGSLMDGTPVTGKTRNIFSALELRAVRPLASPDQDAANRYALYTGLDLQYWLRGLGGASPYNETYVSAWLPLGVRMSGQINANTTVGLDVSCLLMLAGTIYIDAFDVTLDLGRDSGWKVALPFTFSLEQGNQLRITPWYQYTSFSKSNDKQVYFIQNNKLKTGTIYEPASHTSQLGLMVQLGF